MADKISFILLAFFLLAGTTKAQVIPVPSIENDEYGRFTFGIEIYHYGQFVQYAKLDLFLEDFPRLNRAMIFDDITITVTGQKFVLMETDETFSEASAFLTDGLPEWIVVSLTAPTRTEFVEATEPNALFGDPSGSSGIDLAGCSIESIELVVGNILFIHGSDDGRLYTKIIVVGQVTVNVAGLEEFDLTVAKLGSGKGTVTSSPSGIDCGDFCTESYGSGVSVTLTATPENGSIFSGWTGCDTVSEKTCTVEMTEDKRVTTAFEFDTKAMPGIPLLLLDD